MWNDAKLSLENDRSDLVEVTPLNYHFVAGAHIDRDRNMKEYITYLEEFEATYPLLKVHVSKIPLKYTCFPLNVAFDL